MVPSENGRILRVMSPETEKYRECVFPFLDRDFYTEFLTRKIGTWVSRRFQLVELFSGLCRRWFLISLIGWVVPYFGRKFLGMANYWSILSSLRQDYSKSGYGEERVGIFSRLLIYENGNLMFPIALLIFSRDMKTVFVSTRVYYFHTFPLK